jgi:hypothetical protein
VSSFGDMGDAHYGRKPVWETVLGIVIIAGLAFFLLKSFRSGGGLFSSTDCSTNLSYSMPQKNLKGVDVEMKVERCKDAQASRGNKQYVLLTLNVGGSTDDKSPVHSLRSRIRLDWLKPAGGNWRIDVPPSETPEDSGVKIDGANVSYNTQSRWNIRRSPTRVRVALVLLSGENEKTRASHVFNLP